MLRQSPQLFAIFHPKFCWPASMVYLGIARSISITFKPSRKERSARWSRRSVPTKCAKWDSASCLRSVS